MPAAVAEARAHQGLPGNGARVYSEPRAPEAARGEEPGTDVKDEYLLNLTLADAVKASPATALKVGDSNHHMDPMPIHYV